MRRFLDLCRGRAFVGSGPLLRAEMARGEFDHILARMRFTQCAHHGTRYRMLQFTHKLQLIKLLLQANLSMGKVTNDADLLLIKGCGFDRDCGLRGAAASYNPRFTTGVLRTAGAEIRAAGPKTLEADLGNASGARRAMFSGAQLSLYPMTDDFVSFLNQQSGMAEDRVLCEKWW